MLLHANGCTTTARIGCSSSTHRQHSRSVAGPRVVNVGRRALAFASLVGWAVSLSPATAASPAEPEQEPETLENIPQELSGECRTPKDCRKPRIQRPKSRKAESCTTKCVTTCIRGGDGSPGEGPLNIRGPLVVFKEGFRSRRYCLVECSDICNLLGDQDYGP